VAIGYQHRGVDFLIVEVKTSEDWPTVPVGDQRKEAEGNSVLNIASPLGLGRQVFHGSISKLELERPVIEGDINWTGSMLLQMPGTAGGSSGSAVLSAKQEAIVGFIVGTIGSSITAIPATKFAEFRERAAAGKYRWADAKEDQ
jgi:S1-C subfamily serine protease